MPECEQAPGNERLVGRYGGVKRYRDALLADRIATYTRQQASRKARQRAADTRLRISDSPHCEFDRISANRQLRIKHDRLGRSRLLQHDPLRTIAPKLIRG